MFGLQPTHLIIILVVTLLIFGPSRLPELGRAFGKTINELRAAAKEIGQEPTQEASEPARVPKEEPPQKTG